MRLLVLACLIASALQTHGIEAEKAVGRWSGTGTLANPALQHQLGPLPFTLDIDADRSLAGTVGEATIPRTPARTREGAWVYAAVLSGPVKSEAAFRKDRLRLRVTAADGERLTAEFTLSAGSPEDLSALQGRLDARRVRP